MSFLRTLSTNIIPSVLTAPSTDFFFAKLTYFRGFLKIVLFFLFGASEESLNRVRKLTGCSQDSLQFHKIDVCDAAALRKVLETVPQIDSCIHFAGLKVRRWDRRTGKTIYQRERQAIYCLRSLSCFSLTSFIIFSLFFHSLFSHFFRPFFFSYSIIFKVFVGAGNIFFRYIYAEAELFFGLSFFFWGGEGVITGACGRNAELIFSRKHDASREDSAQGFLEWHSANLFITQLIQIKWFLVHSLSTRTRRKTHLLWGGERIKSHAHNFVGVLFQNRCFSL